MLLITALASGTMMQAQKVTIVSTATELITAFNGATGNDTILVSPGEYNHGNAKLKFPSQSVVTVKALHADPDSVPHLIGSIGYGAELAGGGINFEGLKLSYERTGARHIIYLKDYNNGGNISQITFKKCEIMDCARGAFRTVSTKNTEGNYAPGDLDYFEMSDCKVHDLFNASGDSWPIIYFGHTPLDVVVERNTFYDMPYLKEIFVTGYADESGRSINVKFNKNTVISSCRGTLINVGSNFGAESEVEIKDNIIITPTWENEQNVIHGPAKLLGIKNGIVTATNNLIEGYQGWEAGQNDVENGYLLLDTVPQYSYESLNIDNSVFANVEDGDFTFVTGSPLAALASDGGAIGNPSWYLALQSPTYLTTSANIENVTVTPANGIYEKGEEVSVKAPEVYGYTFKEWQNADGLSLSTENPYKFVINEDIEVKAIYDAKLMYSLDIITTDGGSAATISLSPEPVNGVYEPGTEVTLTVNPNAITEFIGWEDGSTNKIRKVTVDSNISVTANIKALPALVAWNFNDVATNKTFTEKEPNYSFNAETNPGKFYLIAQDTVSVAQTRTNKAFAQGEENILYYCSQRRTTKDNFAANPNYYVAEFSTKGMSGIGVRSLLAGDGNMINSRQLVEYSLDKAVWTVVKDEADFVTTNKWYEMNGTLPADANDKDVVYVRWIADPASKKWELLPEQTEQDIEFVYISQVCITANESTGVDELNSDVVKPILVQKGNKVTLSNIDKATRLQIATLDGKVIADEVINSSCNIELPAKGIYIVKVGTLSTKVIY